MDVQEVTYIALEGRDEVITIPYYSEPIFVIWRQTIVIHQGTIKVLQVQDRKNILWMLLVTIAAPSSLAVKFLISPMTKICAD